MIGAIRGHLQRRNSGQTHLAPCGVAVRDFCCIPRTEIQQPKDERIQAIETNPTSCSQDNSWTISVLIILPVLDWDARSQGHYHAPGPGTGASLLWEWSSQTRTTFFYSNKFPRQRRTLPVSSPFESFSYIFAHYCLYTLSSLEYIHVGRSRPAGSPVQIIVVAPRGRKSQVGTPMAIPVQLLFGSSSLFYSRDSKGGICPC
jgi:hypothetical protein